MSGQDPCAGEYLTLSKMEYIHKEKLKEPPTPEYLAVQWLALSWEAKDLVLIDLN